MDSADPSGVRLARPLLPRPLPRRAARGARPDGPERPGHSTDPAGSSITVETPGERAHTTARGQVTTGMPGIGRRPQPVPPSPGASVPKTGPA